MPDDVTPRAPAMRDFKAEYEGQMGVRIVDKPAEPPFDAAKDRPTVDGTPIIVPLDPDGGPPDLDEVVQQVTGAVSRQVEEQRNSTDPLLFPVRSKVRSEVAPILAAHAKRVEDIRNRALPQGPLPSDGDALRQLGIVGADARDAVAGLPADHPTRRGLEAVERHIRARGSLTKDGANNEIQAADRERDDALNKLKQRLGEHLDAVTERCQEVIHQGTIFITDDDRVSGMMLAGELGAASPKHGLPILQWAVREAAVDPAARGPLVVALPALKSLYENADSPYGGSKELFGLLEKATALFDSAEVKVAQERLERVQRTAFEIDQFIQNARDGVPEAMDSWGAPVLLPPEPPPRPLPTAPTAPYQFRRASSAGQREADEQRRRELADEAAQREADEQRRTSRPRSRR